MKVLMLGWEFPPNISGGLGVASQELAESLVGAGHQVTFLLPRKSKQQVSKQVKLLDASSMKPNLTLWKEEQQVLKETELGKHVLPYLPARVFKQARKTGKKVTSLLSGEESALLQKVELTGSYEGDIRAELIKYALLAVQVALEQKFDVVHAHDWITFRAGKMIRERTGLPLFVHVHSTEHDRNGVHAQEFVIREETAGFKVADHIFCVSERLKYTVTSMYHVPPSKVSVTPNAASVKASAVRKSDKPRNIAFVGRLTNQKSPGTLIELARELTSRGYDFHYYIIGDGHLRPELEERVKNSNLRNRMTFTGFLTRPKLLKQLNTIDLLVAPSVSEPFGLVILEAVLKNIPVAAARGVGVAEFIPSLPQVDRWDQFSFVRLIEQLMVDQEYRNDIIKRCSDEANKLSWEYTASLITDTYARTA